MLGILLLYFIGKVFFKLAKENNKNGILFGILGIAMYYVGTIIGGICLGLLVVFGFIGSVDDLSNIELSLLAIPFGGLFCWLFYFILKRIWSKSKSDPYNESILDADLKE